MTLRKLLSCTRKAVDAYHLIDEGDKIAIGVSGGKDSLTLIYALHFLQRYYPNHFELAAVSVDLGFEGFDLSPISSLCESFGIDHHVLHTEIGRIVFEQHAEEKSPCSICAKMRKGVLNKEVKDMGFNKVAYAHNKDDLVQTMLLSLIFEGRFYCFPPKLHLDRVDLTVIRPLIYVDEADIVGFRNKYELPVVQNPCPADGFTRREYVKNILKQLEQENPGVKNRMFTAITRGHIPEWEAAEMG